MLMLDVNREVVKNGKKRNFKRQSGIISMNWSPIRMK
jgi:hypothetical protein